MVIGNEEGIKDTPKMASTTKVTFGKEVGSGGKKIPTYECLPAYVQLYGGECVCI